MSWMSIETLPSEGPAAAGGERSSEMAARLERRVHEKIAAGKFKREDLQYVRDVTFMPVREDLHLSEERLEKLRRLCQLWEVELTAPREISSHRPIIGPLIVGAKKLVFPILRVFLKDTLRRQRDFNAAAIALLADVANEPRGPR